jgi:uncharacterized protein (DUF433 family)
LHRSGAERLEVADVDVASPPIEIVRNPGTRSGNPRIAGTRLCVHDLVSHARLYDGDLTRVVADFPYLTLSQVEAAMAWYAEHQAEIDAIIRQRDAEYERLLATAGTP